MEEQTVSSYLEPTPLLDYTHPDIEQLITRKGWNTIKEKSEVIGEVYSFVRDEITYGYTSSFSIPASQILHKGYGNCITKSTLLIALLRAVGIPCRFHAMTMSKVIFRGLLPGLSYKMAIKPLYHAWVEVQYNNKWLAMEGHIVDRPYIAKLQTKFPDYMGSFYGYGIAVLNFRNPNNRWSETNTYVQNLAIEEELGVFNTPDTFFSQYPAADAYTQSLRYKTLIRRHLNKSIMAVRSSR